jgi:3-oxoacyl-[acyl-carrier protein] reductase
MNLELSGKNYIVSGSSRGIGAGIAEVLLQEGASVLITGRNQDDVANTCNALKIQFPGKVFGHAGDHNDAIVLSELRKKIENNWDVLDGIVANAGAVKPVNDWEISEADWNWYFTSNFNIAVKLVTEFIPYLKKSNSASIVFISSIAGLEEIGAPLPYSASKAALIMYAKGLSRKLANDGIRVNTIAPGNILFPGGNWEKKYEGNPDTINKMIDEKVPLKKFGKPSDIGQVSAFLLSEKANFITGSCIVVDGGQSSKF